MRRLARRLFTLGSAVSLLLCVATCVLWWSTHTGPAGVVVLGGSADHMLDSHRGSVTYVRQTHQPEETEGDARVGRPLVYWHGRYLIDGWVDGTALYDFGDSGLLKLTPPPFTGRPHWAKSGEVTVKEAGDDRVQYGVTGAWDRWGIFLAADEFPDSRVTYHVVVSLPHWLLALAFGWLPGVAFARGLHRAIRPRPLGRCPSCGYDLRASPERCPECGAATTAA